MKFDWLTKLLARRWVNIGLPYVRLALLWFGVTNDSLWGAAIVLFVGVWMFAESIHELARSDEVSSSVGEPGTTEPA